VTGKAPAITGGADMPRARGRRLRTALLVLVIVAMIAVVVFTVAGGLAADPMTGT
jgi:hypothetical protein